MLVCVVLTRCVAPQDKNAAMSRALGAAFLNHQVEELSKKTLEVGSQRPWERRGSRGGGQRPLPRNARQPRNDEQKGVIRSTDREHSSEREDRPAGKKDAGIVVVDASVLVHALGQLKGWCRNNREETIIVPLEGTFALVCSSSH